MKGGKAVAGVADHLRRFWTPFMLGEIAAYMTSGEAELFPIAEQAPHQIVEERRAAG